MARNKDITPDQIAAWRKASDLASSKIEAGNLSQGEQIVLMLNALRSSPLGGMPSGDLDLLWKLALVDLVASDKPLDRTKRRMLADELRRLYFQTPAQHRRAKRKIEAEMIGILKAYCIAGGMKPGKAEDYICEQCGLTRDALKKRLQRAPK